MVSPETLLRWHRDLFKIVWRRKSRPRGQPKRLAPEIVTLIQAMAKDNVLWGAERIRGELLKLGIRVSKRTIQKYMRRVRPPGKRGQSWNTFVGNHSRDPECRRAQDAKRDVQVNPFALRSATTFCAPVRPAVGAGLDKHTPSPTPPTNGFTACRMSLQIFSAATGNTPLRHCENPPGLYAYRGLPALASLSMAGSVGLRPIPLQRRRLSLSETLSGSCERVAGEARRWEMRGRAMCLEGRIQRRKISGRICRQDCTDKGALVRSLDKWPDRCSASQLDRRAEVRRRDGTRDGDRRHEGNAIMFPRSGRSTVRGSGHCLAKARCVRAP